MAEGQEIPQEELKAQTPDASVSFVDRARHNVLDLGNRIVINIAERFLPEEELNRLHEVAFRDAVEGLKKEGLLSADREFSEEEKAEIRAELTGKQ